MKKCEFQVRNNYPIDEYIDAFWCINCPETLTIRQQDQQIRKLLCQILAGSEETEIMTTENYNTGTAETEAQEIVNSMMLSRTVQQNAKNLEYAPRKDEESGCKFSNRQTSSGPSRPSLFIKTNLNSVSPKKTLPSRNFRNQ